MLIDEFVRHGKVLHRLTADFVHAVPEDRWDFTPDAPGKSGRAPTIVCVRGVYNAALAKGKVDWPRKHEHYGGPLTREALLAALNPPVSPIPVLRSHADHQLPDLLQRARSASGRVACSPELPAYSMDLGRFLRDLVSS